MGNFGNILQQQAGGIIGQAGGAIMGALLEKHNDERQLAQQQNLTDMQVNANKDISKFNYGQELQMWHDTNYPAQVEEMEKAGLNPALAYGQGGGGGTTVGSPSGGAGMGQAPAGGGEIMGLMMQKAQLQNMEAQRENIQADTDNKKAENPNIAKTGENITADTAVKGQTLENLKATLKNTNANTTLTKMQTGIAEIEKTVKEATSMDSIRMVDMSAQKLQEDVNQMQNQTEISNETMQSVIKTVRQQAVNAVISGNLMQMGIAVDRQQIEKMAQEVEQGWQGLDLQAQQQKVQQLMMGKQTELMGKQGEMIDEQKKLQVIDRITHGVNTILNGVGQFGKRGGKTVNVNKEIYVDKYMDYQY